MPTQYEETIFKECYLAELDHMHKLDDKLLSLRRCRRSSQLWECTPSRTFQPTK